jgi:uncharacterized protein (DUF305 family)
MQDYTVRTAFPLFRLGRKRPQISAGESLRSLGAFAAALIVAGLLGSVSLAATNLRQSNSSAPASAKVTPAAPVIIQPGAPGQPSKVLPAGTRATLTPLAAADVEFMQGMIVHHSQAVEMTAWIPTHTENPELRALGARISSSQADEMKFMRRWLTARGLPITMSMDAMANMHMDMSNDGAPMMPGMLTAAQMEALGKAKGPEFDHLFLTGMIQHHEGALTMVKDLFNTAGAGQEADIFNFATDADNTQRAEIKIMQSMLEKEKPSKEKQ